MASANAATLYVWQESPSPAPPYTNWTAAAHVIQDAVDAAAPGDTVLVTNGVYATGGRAVYGTMTRVAVEQPLAIQSVNGPLHTFISGLKGLTGAQCAYLTNGARMIGFSLTNGAGGVTCQSSSAVLSNCIVSYNFKYGDGGGVLGGTLYNCTIRSNGAYYRGGGAYFGTLNNCILNGNSAGDLGGGASDCTINDCKLNENYSTYGGAGASYSTLSNCILNGNSTGSGGGGGALYSTLVNCQLSGNGAFVGGGGAYASALDNCTLTENAAGYFGGGAFDCALGNCTLTGNSSLYGGGGAHSGTLSNCTVVGNWVEEGEGGGVSEASLFDCVVYFNASTNNVNYASSNFFNNCCTTPLPTNGTGNIDLDPRFVDTNGWSNLRLRPDSPCLNAGNNGFVSGSTDLDGRPRLIGGTVDMGAYEFQGPGLSEFIGWLQQHALPTDGSADFTDPDTDGHNNWQEWKAWTIPTSALSVLKLLTPQPDVNGVEVRWQSVAGQNYLLERATNVGGSFTLLQSNLVGQAGTTSFTDTNTSGVNSVFYRVVVSE